MIRYRALPPECFAPVEVPALEDGATNEDLARTAAAMRDRLSAQTAVLQRCSGLSSPSTP